jgi:hypothetical protein
LANQELKWSHAGVKDANQEEPKKLSQKLHHFIGSNQILMHENNGLRETLLIRKEQQKQDEKHNKNSCL